MTRLAVLWKNKAISFPTKIKLFMSLVLSIPLYGCERWTLTADLEAQIQAFENKCYRRMLGIQRAWNKHVCWQRVNILARRRELLLSTVKHRKLSWFGHVCCHDTLPKIILQGTVDGGHRRGRPYKSWKDNIKEWTGQLISSLLHIVDERSTGSRRSRCICQSTSKTPERHMSISKLVNKMP